MEDLGLSTEFAEMLEQACSQPGVATVMETLAMVRAGQEVHQDYLQVQASMNAVRFTSVPSVGQWGMAD
ncbi:hypothetical protein [Xenophilus sp. Marseille-Q4582]|uniref:hypothetical protein n=1 Tax=Xenophilus sp. Marseille-Q4582 TaxID=2866600 RepID=UPI001CE43AAC|nr:hypothetical protein [Xenophilus sp. Marseille-Q4582]